MADASRDEAMISEFLEGSGDGLHVPLYSNI